MNWEYEDDKYIFFWKGLLSNWSNHGFDAKLEKDGKLLNFCRAEQYMMAQKAVVFDDNDSLQIIMMTNNPALQKSFGRSVKGFDDEIWKELARDLSYIGIYQKFLQNEKIRNILISTGNKVLAEASPYDRRWGIGFYHNDAVPNKEKWGENWLGQILMKVRDDIRSGEDSCFDKIDWTKYEELTRL